MVVYSLISSTGLKLKGGRALVGCGLYCVLSAKHWAGGGPGSPEGADLRPQRGPPAPRQPSSSQEQTWEVMGLCALAPKKEENSL